MRKPLLGGLPPRSILARHTGSACDVNQAVLAPFADFYLKVQWRIIITVGGKVTKQNAI